jgi:tRNA U55 pseudouridine synthase TruB
MGRKAKCDVDRPLRVGLIGAGGMANYHVAGFQKAGAEVVAIADPNSDAAEAAAEKFEISNVYDTAEEMFARERLDAALKELRGDIYQAPPEFSAVKIPGKTGYEIVRTAESDDFREKLVHVYRYEVADFSPPKLELLIKVAKGVSVRSLARDLGRELGCGASVEDCRRVMCGIHSITNAIPFMKLMEMHPADLAECVIPKNKILSC